MPQRTENVRRKKGKDKKKVIEKVGELAFVTGVLIAIVAGMFLPKSAISPENAVVLAVLLLLGIVVGLINITAEEVMPFLIAAIALLVASNADFTTLNLFIGGIGNVLNSIVDYIAIFVAPAAVISALKVVYALASKR